ncbi:hypothetical protein [Bythopirellula polymerisocia]|uniref:Uncharacterized protein n=1 Tax=Bythopirellula polymerisocia TaxID=2528003 RepID=A0A5C6CV55_9BACT|nr:hypothetical protein [Bythopirellula polymerisocia]TWU27544.1 hypothetical protein Pla144_23210 [Bythopirellula polymerisocia]
MVKQGNQPTRKGLQPELFETEKEARRLERVLRILGTVPEVVTSTNSFTEAHFRRATKLARTTANKNNQP